MRAKREAPKSRSSDRRRRADSPAAATRRTTTNSAPSRRIRSRAGKTSAPGRQARVSRPGPQTSPMLSPFDRPAPAKNTSQAKARAKARKAKAPKLVRPTPMERLAARLTSIDLRPRTLANKVPFVVLVIGSLGVGLGLTLWLSTDAAERSYQLSNARERTRMLQQHKEALERDVREAASAPALAEAARRQGMIPTRDTAHLVQDPDGNWVVVGTPKPADGVPPPPLNTKLPEDPPPPPKPAAVPLEVPVRVTPGPDDPAPPARSGPEVLVRTPDGTATLGGATHLPTQAGPQLPGPVPIPGAPGPMPAPPLGAVPSPAPAENPVPLQVGAAAPPAGLPGPAPVAATPGLSGGSQPMVAPPAPVPANGEQFGPVTAPVPTAPGAPR